jgi:hypothetical protein
MFALWGALLMSDLRSIRAVLETVMGDAAISVLTNFETGIRR